MLHDDHRIADVAQVAKGAQQAFVVALMQADRRFVEDVHHPNQAGADLTGQANTLGFAAGQGVGAAIQGQIIQADVDQELQAFADLLENLVGDLAASSAEREDAEVVGGVADGHGRDRRQGLVANPHVACFAAQTRAATVRAGLGAEVFGELFANRIGFGFAVAAFQVGDDAFERVRALDDIAAVVEVAELYILTAAAAQDGLLMIGGQ